MPARHSHNNRSQRSRYAGFAPALLCAVLLLASVAVRTPATPADPVAFAGAEGFGITTAGGHGGDTLVVTHLRDDGPGSLRWALSRRGARVVTFEVGGLITLRSRLRIDEPFVTVLGQTAPSPGITLRNHDLSIRTHDVVLQHVRVRVGDLGRHREPGTVDGMQVIGTKDDSSSVYNVIVDHCSVSWSLDEIVSIRFARDVTFSNCILSEGLNRSIRDDGAHAFGPMIGDAHRVAFIKNLLAHFAGRNIDIKGATTTFIANNVIYDPLWIFMGINNKLHAADPAATIIGNVCIKGPSAKGALSKAIYIYDTGPATTLYARDNMCEDCVEGRPQSAIELRHPDGGGKPDASIRMASEPPVVCQHTVILAAEAVLGHVLANAGARPWDRDATDQRIVEQVRQRTGGIIDSPSQVGAWTEAGDSVR